jgi:hypothetical protein
MPECIARVALKGIGTSAETAGEPRLRGRDRLGRRNGDHARLHRIEPLPAQKQRLELGIERGAHRLERTALARSFDRVGLGRVIGLRRITRAVERRQKIRRESLARHEAHADQRNGIFVASWNFLGVRPFIMLVATVIVYPSNRSCEPSS